MYEQTETRMRGSSKAAMVKMLSHHTALQKYNANTTIPQYTPVINNVQTKW